MKNILAISMLAVAGIASAQSFSYSYSGGSVAIPDNAPGGASATFTISDSRLIRSLCVGVIVDHSWQGDLTLSVTNGTTSMTLTARPGNPASTFGFSADDYGDVTAGTYMYFKDTAANIYDQPFVATPGINSVTGDWDAEGGSLDAAYAGQSIGGTWTLTAVDSAAGDTGAIIGFQICGEAVPEPATMAALGLGALVAIRRRRAK